MLCVRSGASITADLFCDVRDRDLAALPENQADWIARWEWADEYHKYNGPLDLLRWFDWINPKISKLWYSPQDLMAPLIQKSARKNRDIVKRLRPDGEYRYEHVDEYNAQDFLLQNAYAVPARMQVRRVLDFGAGYGRQVNLWSQEVPGLVYVAVDAIEHSYCLQSFYFQHFDLAVTDYFRDPCHFSITDTSGLYHLPTWRADLLPSDFFDMILCVQVLPEISEPLLRHVVRIFRKSLKPGGGLYIRDHGEVWRPAHQIDVPSLLGEEGFVLEWQPYLVDNPHDPQAPSPAIGPDLHGLPRLWRKRDLRYPQANPAPTDKQRLRARLRRFVVTVDSGLRRIRSALK